MVAAGPLALCSGGRSTQSLQKGLRRAWSPLGPLLSAVSRDCRRACGARGRSLFAVAGAVPRASRRDCGARGRRWAPSPQCLETAEGPAARVVAAGPLALCSGRRSTQSLQKGLPRAWLVLGPSLFAVAGAVPGASRRDCGARGRRWAPCGSARYCHWDLQSNAVSRDCRRACGARGRWWAPRSLQWQAQDPEPPEGTAARVVAAGPPAVLCVTAIVICKAMDVQAANRIVMAAAQDLTTHSLTHSLTPSLTPALSAVSRDCRRGCGAVSRDCRRACGARGRRWAPLSLRSTQSLQKGLRRAWSPLGPLRFCALLPL